MKTKYQRLGLSLSQIQESYPDLDKYDETVSFYLKDEFFNEIGDFLDVGDYALAKDATKGLFLLAGDLMLFPLYESLLEVFADLTEEDYTDVMKHYEAMKEVHARFLEEFTCIKPLL